MLYTAIIVPIDLKPTESYMFFYYVLDELTKR